MKARKQYLKPLVTALLAGALAFAVYWFLIRQPSPEELIRKRLGEIVETVDKSSSETDNSGLLKAAALSKFFTDRFNVEWPETRFSGEYEAREISRIFAASRKSYQSIRFSISELRIDVSAPDVATVDFQLSVDGTAGQDEFSDDRLVHSTWYLVDGKWRIGAAAIRPILIQP